MRESLQRRVVQLGLSDAVRIHGFVAAPLDIVASADLFVLPSLSEGVSRAALEALHLGVPVILRDADGNDELVQHQTNGRLFHRDGELAKAIADELTQARTWPRPSLVPTAMRQRHAARRLVDILKKP
jgi:glycosyltransferase involved in cell wall biosynthesis